MSVAFCRQGLAAEGLSFPSDFATSEVSPAASLDASCSTSSASCDGRPVGGYIVQPLASQIYFRRHAPERLDLAIVSSSASPVYLHPIDESQQHATVMRTNGGCEPMAEIPQARLTQADAAS